MSTHQRDGYTIRTNHDYPPIPDRRWDWNAVLDDYEPGGWIGRGRTEEEAILDLLEQINSEQDELRWHYETGHMP